jgi:predicted MFS family arabinose efflux permease
VCFFSFLATVNTSKFTVAIASLRKEFHTGQVKTGLVVSMSVLALGLGNLLWVVSLRLYGRRPTLLLAILCLAVFNCWSAFAKSYDSLLAATVLAGLAAGGGEAPISSIVADLFPAKQRGTMMMIFHVALSCGFFVGPAINAAVAEFVGWRWLCGWLSIVALANFVVGIFTIHETSYHGRTVTRHGSLDHGPVRYAPKKSFLQQLSLTSGYNKDLRFLTVVWNMVSIVTYPVVPWAGLTIGAFVGW